jgi:starch-binding outer membrane protein, SusD/RagB family
MRRHTTILFLFSALIFTSCTDFFETNPDNITNVDDYISKNDEMYKGFLGILTKLQQAGDQAIFLTDTRCDFLDVTKNAPVDLQNIYNYSDTKGNPYADPTCYYTIVMACNDYISKMKEYREKVGESMDDNSQVNFNSLISSTLRIKIWAYYTIGRIYGKAVWFDDTINELTNLKDSTTFTQLNDMGSIVNKCLTLLDNGIIVYKNDSISADLTMEWAAWLDPESQNVDAYRQWNYLTPEWLLLRCELLSWRGHQDDWQWISDNILEKLFTVQRKVADTYYTIPGFTYSCNIPLTFDYYKQFFTEDIGNKYQFISGIMYDYDNHQTNRLVEYFCPRYPSKYYLKPSSYAIGKYRDEDIRGITQKLCMDVIDGDTCFSKNYYHRGSFLKTDIFKIMPTITLQRGHDYHFLLAEAENHLGHWEQAECILNQGVTNTYTLASYLPTSWNSNYASWFGDNGGYGDVGIAGCSRGASQPLPKPTDPGYALTEPQRMRLYDNAMARAYLLEYTGEGKAYSYLIKMAERYPENGPSFIADEIVPKYPIAEQASVRAAIEAGNYWVDWDLKIDE